jgi:hypothetical protein
LIHKIVGNKWHSPPISAVLMPYNFQRDLTGVEMAQAAVPGGGYVPGADSLKALSDL